MKKQKRSKNKKNQAFFARYFQSDRSKIIGFVVAFGAIGVIALGLSRAATTQLFNAEAEKGSLKQAAIVDNSSASNKKVARLYSNGSSTTISNINLSKPAKQITVVGYGKLCNNTAPIVKIQLDGKTAGQVTLSKTSISNYAANISAAAGSHSLSLVFTNDYYKRGKCDRDAFVDKILLIGEETTPPPTPTPSPTPTPPPSTTPAQGTLLFDGTRLANFHLIQSAANDRIQEVPDPLAPNSGKTVLKFHVCDGDINTGYYQAGTCSAPVRGTPTKDPRAQALSPNIIKDGMEYWVHDEILFPKDFPDQVKGWYGVMTTGFGDPFNGSSPVAISLDDSSDIYIQRNKTYGYDAPWRMHKPLGRWISVTIHEKFSSSGFIEAWIDGQQVTFSNGQKTLYMQTRDSSNNGEDNHVKISSYRQKGTYQDTTIYHRNFRVGTTRAIVEQ